MLVPDSSPSTRWAMAVVAVAVAVAVRIGLDPWLEGQLPYITVFGAVAVAVWCAGPRAASVSGLAGFLAINAWVPGHPGAGSAGSAGFWIACAGFALSAGLIVSFGAFMRRAQRALAAEVARRRLAEETAVESSGRLQATLVSIGDGVAVTDAQGRVTLLNPVAEALTGWTVEEARGQPLTSVFDIVHEDTGEVVPNPALRALAEGRIVGLANHTLLRQRGGPARPIDDSAAPVRMADGHVHGVVLVFRDVSERRRQEDALLRSQSLLRAVDEGTSFCLGVVELTEDDDILHLHDNAGTCRVFGVPPGGTAGRRASELGVARSMIDLWLHHYRLSEASGAPVTFDFQVQSPDGLQWHRATVAPLPRGSAGPRRLSYLTIDITAQHAAQRVVLQSESKSRLALEVASIGVWSWDPDLDRVEADERSRLIAGLPPRGELRLADVMPHIHRDDRKAVRRALHAAVEPGSDGLFGMELRFVHADGSVRWVISRGQLLNAEQLMADARRLMLGTVMDVTARKAAEHALGEADRRKSEFIATLAHELRNPLAPLCNGVAVLARNGENAQVRGQTLGMLERQLALMVRMIDDLLDLSRINRDQLELRRAPVDLRTVVQRGLETSQPLVAARGHRLSLELPSDPVSVDGDLERLTQVMANLLNNAAKYTPAGGSIAVKMARGDRSARVTISDTGIGIPPDRLTDVFEMFSQVDSGTAQARSGLGIGLSICRRLVHMHGGTIVAHSDGEGRGSRFEVTLPVAETESAMQPSAPPAVHGAPPRVVMVVDDNVDAAMMLAELLQLRGHDVHVVHDGPSALERATAVQPDVLFIDIGMPGMDGHELARRFRAQPGGERLLLVALTGWGQPQDRRVSQAAGFDKHVVKPASESDLAEALSMAGADRQ